MKPVLKNNPTIHQILRLCILFGLLGIMLWYVVFQSRLFLAGPEIVLTNEPSPIQHEQIIFLEGIANNIVSLSLNGKEILTDEHGIFRTMLVIEPGYTIMTLRAKDRYGRSTSVTRPFVYNTTPSS